MFTSTSGGAKLFLENKIDDLCYTPFEIWFNDQGYQWPWLHFIESNIYFYVFSFIIILIKTFCWNKTSGLYVYLLSNLVPDTSLRKRRSCEWTMEERWIHRNKSSWQSSLMVLEPATSNRYNILLCKEWKSWNLIEITEESPKKDHQRQMQSTNDVQDP